MKVIIVELPSPILLIEYVRQRQERNRLAGQYCYGRLIVRLCEHRSNLGCQLCQTISLSQHLKNRLAEGYDVANRRNAKHLFELDSVTALEVDRVADAPSHRSKLEPDNRKMRDYPARRSQESLAVVF